MFIRKMLIILLINIINTYASNNFQIKDIHLEGLHRVAINKTLLNLPFKIGDFINNEDISNSIRILFSTGEFESIKVLNDKNILIYQIKERPIITNIIFKGNKSIKNDVIQNNLNLLNIKIGETLDNTKILKFKKELENFYFSIGKYKAKIKSIIIKSQQNQVNLKFVFFEGKYAKIQQINIIGNKHYSTSELLNELNLKDNINLWNFFSSKKYQQEKLADDLNKLRNFYLNRGYIRFQINSSQINVTPDKKNIYITINITEGNQYKLSDIKANINNLDHLNDIKKITTITNNMLYNENYITSIENKIKTILSYYGYAYPHIIIQPEINDKNKTVKLYLHINTGNKIYVRRIYFQGNYITKDSILRRELQQMEGTWLNINLIELGKERLNKTGFFETIDVEIQRIPNNQVNIIYKVKERNIGSINLGLGFGTESGISYQISIKQINLFGSGKEIEINANKNNYLNNIELSFANPYLTNNGISINNKIFYNDFNALNADLSNFNNKSYGFDNFFNVPFNEKNKIKLGINYINNNIYNIRPQAAMWNYFNSIGLNPTINENGRSEENFNSNEVALNLGWTFNTLNDIFFPTNGNKTVLSSKITTPGFKNKYYKLCFNTIQYYPLNKNKTWIILSKLQTGYGNGFYNKQLPFFENFYAGGLNSIRGFQLNNIGPKAIYLQLNKINKIIEPEFNSPSNDAIGGNAIYTITFELITPTPFLNKENSNSIRTSIFIDAGTVWDTNWKYTNSNWHINESNHNKPTHIRSSIGVSLQWISPVGPLIFSYAKPIKNFKNDKIEEFQFNIGRTW
ncbi:outer membrane protein assembly factor BamA [Candidatus Providencia siddallii]|uniref:Outer membrane protein assembly factor BamA n=1 Tax=Candidatus Providencia siddallii TaxID=1715285 RepID=A0ABM9NNY4_9GAMM